jgi:hypothetical protein
VRRAQDELVGALVVQVDEAGVGVEGVCDLGRDLLEHFLEVERRVDGGDRLGQEAQMPLADVHRPIVGRARPWTAYGGRIGAVDAESRASGA